MCGFLFQYNKVRLSDSSLEKFNESLNSIEWRGPDSKKVYSYSNKAIFGHCRLSILDPVPRSDQPFFKL